MFLISLKFKGDDRIPLFVKDHIHLIDISNIIVSNREELSFLLAGRTFFKVKFFVKNICILLSAKD